MALGEGVGRCYYPGTYDYDNRCVPSSCLCSWLFTFHGPLVRWAVKGRPPRAGLTGGLCWVHLLERRLHRINETTIQETDDT